MKILFPFLSSWMMLLIVIPSYAQCDSVEYVVEGVFSGNQKNSLKVKVTSCDLLPEKGQVLNVSKFGEKEVFGGNMTFWLDIATAEVKSVSEENIVLKVIEEHSEIIVKGKKKNHFQKDAVVKLKWKGKAKVIPHLIMEEKDTVEVGQYLCGEKSGQWKSFYPFGEVKNIAYYREGVLDGPYQIYYESGQLQEKGTYAQGVINGEVKTYYENGNLKRVSHAQDGKLHGSTTEYYPSGAIKTEKSFSSGKSSGEVIEYYENGNVASKGSYNENGELDGEALIYYKTKKNQLKIKRTYKNGDRTGIYQSYFMNGNLQVDGYTVNNILDRDYKEYYENKQLKTEGTLQAGKKTGRWSSYFKNGQLSEKGSYTEDLKTGDWEGYFENGEKAFKGTYNEKGEKTGKWITWDENGNKKKEKF